MLDIKIDHARCNLCGHCIDSCPAPCLGFDEAESVVQVFDLDLCLVCRNCEIHCPKDCLVVDFKEWEETRGFRSMVRYMPAGRRQQNNG